MLNLKQYRVANKWHQEGKSFALGIVFSTEGSTYSKHGTAIIISNEGEFCGLVSGGCLEDDIIIHAMQALQTNTPNVVNYDLRSEESEIWGLGAGCRGLINLLILPVTGYYLDFFQRIFALIESGQAGSAIVFFELNKSKYLAKGIILKSELNKIESFGMEDKIFRSIDFDGYTKSKVMSKKDKSLGISFEINKIPNILILGAGIDAVPVANLITEIGWKLTVADHRSSYFERKDLSEISTHFIKDKENLNTELNLREFDVVLVMTHNLEADRIYLSQMAEFNFAYLGLLGPESRKKMILENLEDKGRLLEKKLIGPVGLDIGADGPESIALAVVAEIHAKLKGIN